LTVTTKLLSPRFARTSDVSSAMPLSPKQRQYLDQVHRKLESGEFKRSKVECPCQTVSSDNDVCIAQIDRYGLALDSVLCCSCGTVRIDPYLDEASLSDFYSNYYQDLYARNKNLPHLFQYQRIHYGQRIAECFQNQLTSDSAVLEIGCGTGSALMTFADRGCFVAGCDFSGELVNYGISQGVKNVWTGTFDNAPPVAKRQYDLIYLFHVLEHVAQPALLLSQLQSTLTPNGRILAVVPDLYGIHCHRNPAGDALIFLHIAHKFNYSEDGLACVAQQSQLSARRILPPPREYAAHEDARDLSEMWVEFTPGTAADYRPITRVGEKRLRQLLATEQMFLAGQCPAQKVIAVRTKKSPGGSHPPIRAAENQRPRWYDRVPLVRTAWHYLRNKKKRAA
jgi:SAM-dependent methyltransferase